MTQQPSTATDGQDSWLEPGPSGQERAVAPWWLPIGPGTPIDDDIPDLTDVWLDLWPAPKQPLRSRALSALIPTLVLLLATTGLVVAAAHTYRPDQNRDRTYLPVDGAYAQVSWNGQPGGQLEQAVGNGSGVLTLGRLGEITLSGESPDWGIGHDLWIADATTDSGTLRAVMVVSEEAVTLQGVMTDRDAALFKPALPVSHGLEHSGRTEQAVGRTWGTRGSLARFSAAISISVDADCLRWNAVITPQTASVQPLDLTVRVCRDSGVQQIVFARPGQTPVDVSVTGQAPAAGRWDGAIDTEAVTPGAVASWKPRMLPLQRRDPTGTADLLPVITRQPLVIGDGRFVVIGNDNNLSAFDAGTTTATSVWTAHPGGRISHLITAGDLVIVATDQRRLVAYDQDGRRVWQRPLPDLVADAVVVGDRLVASIFTGVVLSLDVRTGTQVWRQDVDTVRSTPGVAASDQMVAVVDADSTVHALDFGSGEERGATEGANIGGLSVEGRDMVMLRSDRLLRIDTAPKRTEVDVDTRTGDGPAMLVAGSVAVINGPDGMVVVDVVAGTILDRQPTVADLTQAPGAVAVARADNVTVYTPSASGGTTWSVGTSAERSVIGMGSWGVVGAFDAQVVVIS